MDTALSRSRKRLIFWAALAVAALAMVSLVRTDLGTAAIRAAGLSAPPTPFTELYFDDTDPLPGSVPVGVRIALPVTFILANGTDQARAVEWSVGQAPSTGPIAGPRGVARLGPGERRPVQATLNVRCAGPSTELVVEVVGEPVLITREVRCIATGAPR